MSIATDSSRKANPWDSVDIPNNSTFTSVVHREPYPSISPTRLELSQAGRTVLVAGGSTGIGFSIAESFGAAGATRIILTGRRQGALDEALAKIKQAYPDVKTLGLVSDFGDEADVGKLWSRLRQDEIFVDVLVLNAAKMWLPNTLLGLGSQTVKDGFAFNVVTPFLWIEWFHKQKEMQPSKKLILINLTSVVVHSPDVAGPVPLYSLTKSASTAMMQSIAYAIPAKDMQIISMNPGMHYTESFQCFAEADSFPWDDLKLPGDFSVWAASDEAEFLHGRFVWANWDVDELQTGPLRERIENDPSFLKMTVKGL
ncbi:hypothetical protein BHE90_004957 [Fusarium euwallaceae]|uniref:Peroxisomal short-chain alcohol dehydrogenase n=3 Tax=Fusarium solani species complex TaxID=232080 RepID=A0A428U3W1_9HYPO|nr:hypothetical protein CEP51_015563 [Fusarium floridanum]RSM08952.1 hypothetical protein CEP52_004328 [Fusarium oligoseptatum]RTE80521.1 hypothetical protein BHE90_004957 [Fusarium euwallaceae]